MENIAIQIPRAVSRAIVAGAVAQPDVNTRALV
jgi:hypothetical protein